MKKTNKIEEQIAKLDVMFDSLVNGLTDSGEYSRGTAMAEMEQILKLKGQLVEMQGVTKTNGWKNRIDINTLISGGISIATVLIILNYEKADIITSKAFSLATKR